VNTDVLWPDRELAESQVLRIQIKLHQWAIDDPDRRFDDLFNLVCEYACMDGTAPRVEGTKMAEMQGKGTGAGRPVLNIERIYSTTVSAEELARALADHFRAQEFEAQVYRTSGDRTVMQAR
jgi:hypothetical protein